MAELGLQLLRLEKETAGLGLGCRGRRRRDKNATHGATWPAFASS